MDFRAAGIVRGFAAHGNGMLPACGQGRPSYLRARLGLDAGTFCIRQGLVPVRFFRARARLRKGRGLRWALNRPARAARPGLRQRDQSLWTPISAHAGWVTGDGATGVTG